MARAFEEEDGIVPYGVLRDGEVAREEEEMEV